MNRSILNIIITVISSILLIGCTSVGAINLPANLNNGEEHTEVTSPNNSEDEENLEEINRDEHVEEASNDEANKNSNDKDSNNNQSDVEKDSLETESEKKEYENSIVEEVHYFAENDKKQVALTFDDGPESKYTAQILEILNEYDIKATFFVIGQEAEKHPEVLKQIHEEGHEIGNHTWNHKYLPKISEEEVDKEVLNTEKIIKDIIGEIDYVFRPPYGAIKKRELKHINSLGYNVVNWSVDTKDWAGTSKEEMMGYLKKQITPGGIILMHNKSNSKNTVEFLPEAIEWIIEQGYEFGTASEVLDI